jgi:hypothetical protein
MADEENHIPTIDSSVFADGPDFGTDEAEGNNADETKQDETEGVQNEDQQHTEENQPNENQAGAAVSKADDAASADAPNGASSDDQNQSAAPEATQIPDSKSSESAKDAPSGELAPAPSDKPVANIIKSCYTCGSKDHLAGVTKAAFVFAKPTLCNTFSRLVQRRFFFLSAHKTSVIPNFLYEGKKNSLGLSLPIIAFGLEKATGY